MFHVKYIEKDMMFYCAFKEVIEKYDFKVESPAHSVIIYQYMIENNIIDRSHCIMKKIATAYNRYSQREITNYSAAQYYYKTYQKHGKNYKGEGTFEQQKPQQLDFTSDISFCVYNDLFE